MSTELYTLSLHDALPIYGADGRVAGTQLREHRGRRVDAGGGAAGVRPDRGDVVARAAADLEDARLRRDRCGEAAEHLGMDVPVRGVLLRDARVVYGLGHAGAPLGADRVGVACARYVAGGPPRPRLMRAAAGTCPAA